MDNSKQQQVAQTNLQFVAFLCGQLMAIITKLLQREKFTPGEDLAINKAYEEISRAKNRLERFPKSNTINTICTRRQANACRRFCFL